MMAKFEKYNKQKSIVFIEGVWSKVGQHLLPIHANVAQLVEHLHGKEKVTGSIPVIGSIISLCV